MQHENRDFDSYNKILWKMQHNEQRSIISFRTTAPCADLCRSLRATVGHSAGRDTSCTAGRHTHAMRTQRIQLTRHLTDAPS